MKRARVDTNPSVLAVFGQADVVQYCICPYLTLKEQSCLSMVNKTLYEKLTGKNIYLKTMRCIMKMKELTLQDKKLTICYTGLLPCVKHLWFLEHGLHGKCSQKHFAMIAAARGHADVLKFLNSKVDYLDVIRTRKFFMLVVCTLVQNNFLDLAFSVFSNENTMWWNDQTFCLFRSEEKYTCWKTAVEHGFCDLENRMVPAFVAPTLVDRLPGTRLLIAAETFNAAVFDTYWNAMSNDKLVQIEYGEHAALNVAQLAIRGEHGLKPTKMLQHITNNLHKIQNEEN